jgi:hypothetical protein
VRGILLLSAWGESRGVIREAEEAARRGMKMWRIYEGSDHDRIRTAAAFAAWAKGP